MLPLNVLLFHSPLQSDDAVAHNMRQNYSAEVITFLYVQTFPDYTNRERLSRIVKFERIEEINPTIDMMSQLRTYLILQFFDVEFS